MGAPLVIGGKVIAGGLGGLAKMAGGILGGLGSMFGGLFGARRQEKAQQAMAREQMAFQERMSSTAYQRAAKDLEAAGLNRIMALGSPSSSPGGAMGTAQNQEAAGLQALLTASTAKQVNEQAKNTATQRNNIRQELKNLQEVQQQTRSNTDLIDAQKRQAEAQAGMEMLRYNIYKENPNLMRRDIIMNGSNAKSVAGALIEAMDALKEKH